MTKTVTYTCEISLTQTKEVETGNQEENTCMIEITCDDEAIQYTLDNNAKVALASTGQLLSIAVGSIIMEQCASRGLTMEAMLAEFMIHVAHHINSGGERIDPEILKFNINLP